LMALIKPPFLRCLPPPPEPSLRILVETLLAFDVRRLSGPRRLPVLDRPTSDVARRRLLLPLSVPASDESESSPP
jgi:hypothetical protein